MTNTSTNSENDTSLVVDIPKLIGQTPEMVEKSYGKATDISKTNDPDWTPGEIRTYKLANAKNYATEDGMTVRFYKGRAVSIMVDLPSPSINPAALLLRTGIDVGGQPPNVEAPAATRWRNKTFAGIKFKDVAAHKLDEGYRNFTTVQVEVEKNTPALKQQTEK